MRQAHRIAAASLGMLALGLPSRAAPPAPVSLYAEYAAIDPGTDSFAALLARGGGLRSAGLPSFGLGVVTTEAERRSFWSTGFARSARLRSRPGESGLTGDTAGFAAGADQHLGDNAIAGIAVSHADTSWAAGGGAAKGRSSTTGIGAYAAASWPDVLYGAAAVQYGFDDAVVQRTGARGRFSPHTVRAGGTVGHFIDLSGFTFNPLAEIEYSHSGAVSLRESGAGALSVDVPGQDTLTARLGVRISSAFFRWGILGSPHVAVLWQRRLQAADALGTLASAGSTGVVDGGVLVSLPHHLFAGFDASTSFGGRLDERVARVSLALGF